MKEKEGIKDKIIYAILKFITYDNEHHCFKYFVLGFSIATLIAVLLK